MVTSRGFALVVLAVIFCGALGCCEGAEGSPPLGEASVEPPPLRLRFRGEWPGRRWDSDDEELDGCGVDVETPVYAPGDLILHRSLVFVAITYIVNGADPLYSLEAELVQARARCPHEPIIESVLAQFTPRPELTVFHPEWLALAHEELSPPPSDDDPVIDHVIKLSFRRAPGMWSWMDHMKADVGDVRLAGDHLMVALRSNSNLSPTYAMFSELAYLRARCPGAQGGYFDRYRGRVNEDLWAAPPDTFPSWLVVGFPERSPAPASQPAVAGCC